MRTTYLLFFLILLLPSAKAVNWQCQDNPYVTSGTAITWQGIQFTYSGVVESATYPGYLVDPTFTVLSRVYRSNYSAGPSWSKITQPNFTIQPTNLFSSPDAVHVEYCVDLDYVPSAPTPSPTIPTLPTPTGTTGSTGSLCAPGNSSCTSYHEGDYQNLNNRTLPSDSHGFKEILEGNGYQASVGGAISMAKDYVFLYVIVGMILFIGRLWK